MSGDDPLDRAAELLGRVRPEARERFEEFLASDDANGAVLRVVSLDEFVAVDEPGADPLVGDGDGGALVPKGGDVMLYGDGGAGKTTLGVDLAMHLAAGDDWLGMLIAEPSRVLIVENEGPRPLFRAKLRRKRDAWPGSPVGDRVQVVEVPWASVSFAGDQSRQTLADAIREGGIDVVILGPVTRAGMNTAGTLQEVRDFAALVGDVRRLAGRAVTFVLIHHENKGGQVSGAWEGACDTLLHVQGGTHGHTRLFVQKARWASAYHGRTLVLRWTDGEGFAVVDARELTDDALADAILEAVKATPGCNWKHVESQVKGINADRRRAVRDRMLEEGVIVNTGSRGDEWLRVCPPRHKATLFAADDPSIRHLDSGSDADQIQTGFVWPGDESGQLESASRPYRDADQVDADPPAAEELPGRHGGARGPYDARAPS